MKKVLNLVKQGKNLKITGKTYSIDLKKTESKKSF